MRTNNFQKKILFIEIALIIILGLIPLLWFKPGFVIKSDDFDLPVNFSLFKHYLLSWNHLRGVGMAPLDNFPALFFFFIQAVLSKINCSFIFVEKLQFVFWFMLPGFSMNFLMHQLLRKPELKVATLMAITFYMVNFYLESIWQGFNVANLSAYAFIPFLLGVFIKGLKTDGVRRLKSLFLFGFISVAASGMGVNPPVLVLFFSILILFFIYYLLFINKPSGFKNCRKFVFYLAGIFLIFVLFNFYWIFPALGNILDAGIKDSLQPYQQSASSWLKGICANTSALNVLRMQGSWTWYESWKWEPYIPYSKFYRENFLFVVLSFIMPLTAFASVLFYKKNRYVFFFVFLAVLGTFFGMGRHEPFGFIYLLLLKFVPGFWSFRSPWYKFTLLTCLGYSFLIGIVTACVYEWLKGRFSEIRALVLPPIFLIAVVGMHLIYVFPLVRGDIFPGLNEREYLSSFHARIPDYAFEARTYLEKQAEQGRILVLPDKNIRVTEWGYIGYAPLISYLVDRPVITSRYINDELSRFAYECLYHIEDKDVFSKVLSLLGVRFILHEKDIKLKFYQGASNIDYDTPQFIEGRLDSIEDVEFVKSFGRWDLYEVKNVLPHIFAVSGESLKKREESFLFEKIEDLDKYMHICEGSGQRRNFNLNAVDLYFEPWYGRMRGQTSSITPLEFKMVNPTEYRVDFNEKEPLCIVFLERYDSRWQAVLKVKDEDLCLTEDYSRRLDNHFALNSYANGWHIDLPAYLDFWKERNVNLEGRNFEIMLQYRPQKFFNIGALISSIAVSLGLITCVMIKRRPA